jgi:hypothetical protein
MEWILYELVFKNVHNTDFRFSAKKFFRKRQLYCSFGCGRLYWFACFLSFFTLQNYIEAGVCESLLLEVVACGTRGHGFTGQGVGRCIDLNVLQTGWLSLVGACLSEHPEQRGKLSGYNSPRAVSPQPLEKKLAFNTYSYNPYAVSSTI